MPSNLALIKYMGKKRNEEGAQATNVSFSVTLPYLLSEVRLKPVVSRDEWQPLVGSVATWCTWNAFGELSERFSSHRPPSVSEFKLSESGRSRFLNWWLRLKSEFGIKQNYAIFSGNNFPSDCGIASSSSSFAALTFAAYVVATQLERRDLSHWSLERLALLSAQGSGASGRSFFRPAALWRPHHLEAVALPLLSQAWHQVFIVSAEKKTVSSSEAHQRVFSSLLFRGRDERAEQRLRRMLNVSITWAELYQLAWEEFWDMHALFETSRPTFGYMLPQTLTLLGACRSLWEMEKDGPVVTMDAGANVHLLWRKDQTAFAQSWAQRIADQWNLRFLQGALF
jgi:diphosphomevalonate decarboxylase